MKLRSDNSQIFYGSILKRYMARTVSTFYGFLGKKVENESWHDNRSHIERRMTRR